MLLFILVAQAGTTIDVDVVGPLAEITLQRRFQHVGAVPIDAELLVPVPDGAAIDGVTVTVGDRVLTSRVVERAQAQRVYADAANAGRVATLLEQASDDVVVQRVANVLPGDEVTVEIHLVVPVDRHAGVWELVLPLTVAPRFRDELALVHAIPAEALDGVPDWAARFVRPADRADIAVTVHGGTPLRFLESPSHAFQATTDGAEGALHVSSTPMDRDLVVRWATAMPEPVASLLVADGHGVLLLEAPAPYVPVTPAAGDLVVLIDASDSMLGLPSAQIPEVVAHLLGLLRPDDRVTVLRYADWVHGVAVREPPEAAPAIVDGLRWAWLGGGSDLPRALDVALAVPAPPERALSVLLITDGATGEGRAVADRLRRYQGRGVIHTLAVGPAPNHALLGAIAEETGGMALTLSPGASIAEALAPVRHALAGPILTDVVVDWGTEDAEAADHRHVQLYADRAVTLHARGLSCDVPATVTGRWAGQPYAVVVAPQCVDAARPLAVLWARARLDWYARLPPELNPSHADLAVAYQLLTEWTSFVGTDDQVTNPGGLAALSRFSVPLPYGVEVTATTESTVMSKHIRDPVTGTFSVNFNFDAITELEQHDPVALPHEGLVLDPPIGGSNLAAFGLTLGAGALPRGSVLDTGHIGAWAGGPLVRDGAWLRSEVGTERRMLGGVYSDATRLNTTFTAQPNADHRVTLTGALAPGRLPAGANYGRTDGAAHWQWFLAPEARTSVEAGAGQLRVGSAVRERAGGVLAAGVSPGPHDVAAGLGAASWRWADGVEQRALTVSAFAEDDVDLDTVRLAGGLRVDAVVTDQVRVLPGPRIFAVWKPGDGPATVAAGLSRSVDIDRLVPPGTADTQAPTRTAATLQLEVEVTDRLFLFAHGLAEQQRLPFAAPAELVPVPQESIVTVARQVPSLTVGFRREMSRRFEAGGSWTLTPQLHNAHPLVTNPLAPFVPDFLEAYRKHRVDGLLGWRVPQARTQLSAVGTWATGVGEQRQWWLADTVLAGGALAQPFSLRKGTVTLSLSAEVAVRDPRGAWLPLQTQFLVPAAPTIGDQPPLWLKGTLSYQL